MRVGSREERGNILLILTQAVMDDDCQNVDVLRQVDRLCRRTWNDIHPGWIRWAYYVEKILGRGNYESWARDNCKIVR